MCKVCFQRTKGSKWCHRCKSSSIIPLHKTLTYWRENWYIELYKSLNKRGSHIPKDVLDLFDKEPKLGNKKKRVAALVRRYILSLSRNNLIQIDFSPTYINPLV